MAITHPIPSGRLTDRFGPRGTVAGLGDLGTHTGQDWAATEGMPIRAAHSGTILRVWWDAFPNGVGAGGHMVSIRGDDGYETRYAHMMQPSHLPVGSRVIGGTTTIGYVGATGAATGSHLHFEVLRGGTYVDPLTLVTEPSSIPETSGGYPMFDVYWTGPHTGKTNVSGRLVTNYGSFWVYSPQIMNLLERRKNAALKPGTSDNMLDAEHEIINSFLRACFQSVLSGVQFDQVKLNAALNDAFKAMGKNIVIDGTTDIDPDLLAAAFEQATPRIVAAMLKQAGQQLSK